MSNKTPVFPFKESQNYSDYGFDPQVDYFQVLEEARKHKRECYSRSKGTDTSQSQTHFKFQKPISKDESSKKIKKNKKRWWKNALLFFKRKWPEPADLSTHRNANSHDTRLHRNGIFRGTMLGPVYITESRSTGSSTPYLTASRPSSGPLAGILTPAEKGELQIPYISLREINMDQQSTKPTSAMPIYLVT